MIDTQRLVGFVKSLTGNKIVTRTAGGVILAFALFYIMQRILALDPNIAFSKLSAVQLGGIVALTICYAALLPLLAFAWAGMAAPAGQRCSFREAVVPYGRAVIAKYIPGSVLQYASRQMSGAKAGFSHSAMASASVAEILLHLTMALTIGGAALLWTQQHYWIGGGSLALSAIFLLVAKRRNSASLNAAIILQALFFIGFLVVIFACALLFGGDAIVAAELAGIFMFAWLAGFVVPVAPGGIGIREAALMALAGSIAPADTILIFAAGTRAITLFGDLLLGGTCYLVRAAPLRRNRQALSRQ